MSATFRKAGSMVAFTWAGKVQDPRDQAFADALATRRFRTIDTAASEEVSAGWVTPEDPSGNQFALEVAPQVHGQDALPPYSTRGERAARRSPGLRGPL